MEYGKISVGFDHGGDYTGELVDVSANIGPLSMPEEVRSALFELADGDGLERYPDPTAWNLCRKIAMREGIEVSKLHVNKFFLEPEDYILCGNGAVDLIYRTVLAVRPKTALVVEPTFSEYKKALALVGCDVRSAPLTEETAFMLTEAFLDELTEDLDMVFLCSPNNPTGQSIPLELFEEIAKRCHKHDITLLWDASFLEFSEQWEKYHAFLLKAIGKYENFLALRSFTKIYAMAGVRLGYLMSSNVRLLNTILVSGPPWSVSAPAQAAGVAALKNHSYVEEARGMLESRKEAVIERLEELGFSAMPTESPRRYLCSDTNFLLLHTERGDLASVLESDHGVKVRRCETFDGLDSHWVRIAIRDKVTNEKVLGALKGALGHE